MSKSTHIACQQWFQSPRSWFCSFALLVMSLLFSGCILTEGVTHQAMHGSTAFVPDRIRRIEKAFVTPEGSLVVLLEGRRAESATDGRFTMTIPLPAEGKDPWALVSREQVAGGWDPGWQQRTSLAPVAIGPPVSAVANDVPWSANTIGMTRALYPVKERWANDKFWYVVTDGVPKKYDVVVRDLEVRTPHRYSMLLLVPLTVPADLVLFPFECYGMYRWAADEPHASIRTVSIMFLPLESPRTFSIAADGPEVQACLGILDTVLAPEGLLCDEPDSLQNQDRAIAYYHHSPEAGQSCEVFVGDSGLDIVFSEYGHHPGSHVKRVCRELAKELKAHFGANRVRVEIR